MKTERYLWMEQFLNDELSTDEINKFKQKLSEDASFKEDFELFKEMNQTFANRIGNEQQTKVLKDTLSQLGEKYIQKESKSNSPKVISINRFAKFMVAAGLVLLAGIFFLKKGKPTYTDYNNFDKIELTVRSNETNEHLKKAEEAFNTKNYAEAEKELELLLNEDKTKISLQLYLAVCLMEQNKFKKAEKILKKIKNGESVYKSKATWYLALSKLKRQDYPACKEYLQAIPKDAPEYKDAQELLNRL